MSSTSSTSCLTRRDSASNPRNVNELHYAVVVGIDRYPGISDLTGAKADATKFAEWLLDPDEGALPRDNVQVLVKSPDEEATYMSLETAEPTQDSIDDALRNVVDAVRAQLDVDRSAWQRTRLYLYVAGHGFAPAGSEGSLLVANAGPGIYSRNLDLPRYRAYCSACAFFSEVVIFADCCRTRVGPGPAGTGPRLDPCPAPYRRARTRLADRLRGRSRPRRDELTFGEDDEARGYFTAPCSKGCAERRRIPRRGDRSLTRGSRSPGRRDHHARQAFPTAGTVPRRRAVAGLSTFVGDRHPRQPTRDGQFPAGVCGAACCA